MATPEIVQKLQLLRNEADRRLKSNPDYIAIKEIDRAIEVIMGAAPLQEEASERSPSEPPRVARMVGKRISQGDATETILRELAIPTPIEALLPLVERVGVKLTGKKSINLSSSLSRDERFESIAWKGSRCWWFRGEPLPEIGASQEHREGETKLLTQEVTH